jgi:hypothetical protein
VGEIEPELAERSPRERPAFTDRGIFEDNRLPVQSADDGVMATSQGQVRRLLGRTHPIDDDRHAFSQPPRDMGELGVISDFGGKPDGAGALGKIDACCSANAARAACAAQSCLGDIDIEVRGHDLETCRTAHCFGLTKTDGLQADRAGHIAFCQPWTLSQPDSAYGCPVPPAAP